RYPAPGMPWHPDGRLREGSSSGLRRLRGAWEQQRHARYPDQQHWQWRLGTTWESRALASALCRSVLLACARASPAETWKCPGGGDVDAFLGVKGSPVQIRPSRRVFRTLVPRSGNENCHDHSHLTGRDEQSIQDGGHAILMTALPPWPGSPARRGRVGSCLPTAGAGGS